MTLKHRSQVLQQRRQKLSRRAWLREINDLIRGMAGGFLFGVPLLYTMEVWWVGSSVEPSQMLGAIATAFCVVFLLNRTAGFRRTKDIRVKDAVMDSVEALAIGLLCAACTLALLREIKLDAPLREILGKLIFESIPFTFGVALANQFLSTPSDEADQPSDQAQQPQQNAINATLADIGATLIGSMVIAFNIAPTDEVPMLASAVSGLWLLALMAASLIISYGIVFQAGFADQKKRHQQRGVFQRPLSETVASYLVSLLAAAFMLWFFQRVSLDDPWSMWLSYTLILGLPATVGGAAGRLAV